jgi:hypothetical protein
MLAPTDLATFRASRKPDRRTEAADLLMEVRAAGQEMVVLGRRLEVALMADRADIAYQLAGRLQVLGASYRDYREDPGYEDGPA